MRLGLKLALLASFLVAAPAYAEDDIVDVNAAQWGADRGEGTGASLLNLAVTDFGRPNPDNPNALPLKVGYAVDASLAQAYTTLGPCDINAQFGQVSAEASFGFDGGSASTERGPGADRSVKTNALPSCNLSAEANLVSVSAECETAIGTFAPTVKGPGAQASCDCDGCEAGAYWVWGELTYTTPSVGGCGVKVSAEVSVEGGLGVKAGAGRQGDVGAKATLGPVGLGAGINIDEFDPGALGDCLVNAGQAVLDGAAWAGNQIADGAQAVWDGAGDLLDGAADLAGDAWDGATSIASDIGDGLSSLGGSIADGIGGLFGGGGGGGGLFGGLFGGGGNNTPRVSNTVPGTGTDPGSTAGTAGPGTSSDWSAGTAR